MGKAIGLLALQLGIRPSVLAGFQDTEVGNLLFDLMVISIALGETQSRSLSEEIRTRRKQRFGGLIV